MSDTTRQWRKSSYSGGNGSCVEVALDQPGTVGVRDSENVPGPELTISSPIWSEFIQRIKHGEFSI